jgi:hypothetical protein
VEGLIEGRIVHYVLTDGDSEGQCRPAIILKVWDREGETGCCNVLVFTDASNDGGPYRSGLFWATSRSYDADKKPGTWHWIEHA